jgi:FkbM family methyltransferase
MPGTPRIRESGTLKRLVRSTISVDHYEALAKLKRVDLRFDPILLLLDAAMRVGKIPPLKALALRRKLRQVERMDYARSEIKLQIESEFEHEIRLKSCAKEADTVEWIETLIRPGDVLFDVGANVGAYSLVAGKYFHGGVKVYAFEPAFLNFAQLCRNIALNGCGGSVIPLGVALSDSTRLGEFNYHDLEFGGSLHTLGAPIDHMGVAFEPVFRQPVMSYRMDDLIEQFQLPAPNHIKLDVDGIELAILAGAARTLASGSVRSVLVELEKGEKEQRVTDALRAHGFSLSSAGQRDTPELLNCIFVRNG